MITNEDDPSRGGRNEGDVQAAKGAQQQQEIWDPGEKQGNFGVGSAHQWPIREDQVKEEVV